MTPVLSVIICTHDPRPNYLDRVIAALKAQTLPHEQWELLLVDNASNERLAETVDLTWHDAARHIREEELGLTPARLRGIGEAKGDLLVFVDDDNVLEPDYLVEALRIMDAFPFLGAWGGTIEPEFEAEPAEWTRPLWGALAIREIEAPIWSNDPNSHRAQPCGAGLCVRKSVARSYHAALQKDAVRRKLDRSGGRLLSTGDTDLILTANENELGWGNFPTLKMRHIIPAARLSEDYFARLLEGMAVSSTAMAIRRGAATPRAKTHFELLPRYVYRLARFGRRAARFYLAEQRGIAQGIALAKGMD